MPRGDGDSRSNHHQQGRYMTRQKPWTLNEIFENSIPEPNTGCWLWLLSLNREGYPRSSGKFLRAHRASWAIANGPIPDGKEIHHKCRMRSCVNPSHLDALTYAEHRAADFPHGTVNQNSHKTECRRGHPLSGHNLILEPGRSKSGFARRCRACRNSRRSRQSQPQGELT